MKFFCFSLMFLVSPVSYADQFLGEEPKSAAESVDQEAEAPKVRGKKTPASSSKGTFGFSASIGAAAGFFAASGAVTYGFNPYVALSTSYDYQRMEDSDRFGEKHGPDLALVLRLANPTMVTPVAGAGPGYLYWTRKYKDMIFDEAQSPVMTYFAGLNIALSKNFGVSIHRRKIEYLRNVPIRFSDRSTKEERSQIGNNIGFYASF